MVVGMVTNVICALLILAAEPAAQTDRALTEAHEVFACDFESQTDQNHDAWPDEWTRRRGRGYPVYIPIAIAADDQPPKPDNHCLKIKLDGSAAQLYSPAIPVVPQFSYQLTAKIRTRDLKYDVVSFSVSFYDGEDNLLETHESPAVREVPRWTSITIGPVTPAGERVRTAVVSLHVRPTDQADLTGEICVDDLWLGRLPKLSVRVGGENGIYTDPKAVRVDCRVSGLKSNRPPIKFELLDVHGTVLAEKNQTMDAEAEARNVRTTRIPLHSDDRPGFAGGTSWQPPVTLPGYYTVRVSTPSHSGLMMKEEVSFVVLPALTRAQTGEFGWSLSEPELPVPVRSLPSLLSQVGVHWVKYPVWFNAQEARRADEVAWFAERLSSFDIQLVGMLDQPPPEVRAVFGAADQIPIATAFADKALWHPALDPVLTRLSLKVRWWQLGRDDDTSFASFPDVNDRLRDIRDELSKFGQRVNVGIPWQAIQEHPLARPMPWAFLSLVEDLPFTDDELKSYVKTNQGDQVVRWMMLQPLSDQEYSLETRARDLVRRMLAAKIAGVGAIFIPQPFAKEHGLMHANGSPAPLLLAWRTTAMLLGGGVYAGNIKLPHGSENHIFVRADDAVMVVWNDRPVTETVFLGENIKHYDVWGSPIEAESSSDEVNGQRIQVGPMPTFITGVNPALAKWGRDFRFETERLASVFGRNQLAPYQFTNTFAQGLGGRVKFNVPPDWKVQGAERQFKLGPGETLQDALRVSLGADAPSGLQPVRIDFELNADRNYKFSLYETIQVGLGDVLVQLETRLDENGNLVIDQYLTNNTDNPVSFKCLLSAPGRRRERQQVMNLGRGRAMNQYILPNGKELLGQVIWFRAEEIDGARVLNDQVVVQE